LYIFQPGDRHLICQARESQGILSVLGVVRVLCVTALLRRIRLQNSPTAFMHGYDCVHMHPHIYVSGSIILKKCLKTEWLVQILLLHVFKHYHERRAIFAFAGILNRRSIVVRKTYLCRSKLSEQK
jgi:hypothetical protein